MLAVSLLAVPIIPAVSAAAPTVTLLTPSGGQRGTTVEMRATGTFDKWPVQVWASDKAVTATATATKGTFRVTIAKDAALGICWLRWYDDAGASSLRPFVIGTLPEIVEVEPNDEPAKAQAIDASAVVNGKLARSGDVDCFAVKLKHGQTLVADLVAHEILRSPMDAVLQVLSANGAVLEENHDYCGLDPRIPFTAPRDGTYIVRLFAFPAQPDSSIRFFGSSTCVYRLTLTTAEFVDFVTPLAVERKGSPTVTLHGWNVSAPTRQLPPSTEPFSMVPGTAVHVQRETHPCYDLIQSKPQMPLMVPFSVTGRIAKPHAVDTISFKGVKGKSVSIRIESSSLNLLLNPVIRVLDSGGKQLTRIEQAKPNVDIETTFAPPSNGTYGIEIGDLLHSSGPRHAYCLHVTPVGKDFSLTVAEDRYTLSPGKPLDIAVTVVRKNGFSGEVELSVQGLPAQVTATQVDKSNGKTLTIRLTAKKGGMQVPIRIVGKSKGEPAVTHDAFTAVNGFDSILPDLWLTVGKSNVKK